MTSPLDADPQAIYSLSLDDLIRRPAWMADAACREHPQRLWFPAQGDQGDEARAICARCLVREECAAYVLTLPSTTEGIWAGMSRQERRRRRRDAQRPPA